MSSSWRRRTRVIGLCVCMVGLGYGGLAAQQSDEPVLDRLRDRITSPELTLRFLVQSIVDVGIDAAPTNARIGAARVRAVGEIDQGFNYMLQTDFARAPSLLDARVGWTADSGLSIHAGRFKTPFSSELLTYVGALDFIGRARVVSALSPGRQIGLQVGGPVGDLVTLTVGAFTGGSNTPQNEALVGVGRISTLPIDVAEGELTLSGHVAVGRDAAIAGPNGAGFEGDGVVAGLDARFESGRLLLASEFIYGDWDPVFGPVDISSDGISATAGWTVVDGHRALARWDRYRAPAGADDDLLVLGYNVLPISAVELQFNWRIPLSDGGGPHALLANFEVGF